MTAFCLDTITQDDSLRPDHGVLRIAAFAVTADAREAAQRIRDSAQADADALLRDARMEAARLVQEAETQTLQRADALIKALEQANATFLQQAEDLIIELAKGLFDRLVLEATPREKLEAALKRILQEAPPKLVDPMLRVHPDDAELLPEVEWEVKVDASLMPGSCRLEAASGEWCADFGAAIAALTSAFARVAETPIEE
ncbi:flagellar biosynthesis/type III secretory pathway protein [Noviherbaspirillum cavernae]|uniref:Flagellar biosynthesis/type III secretory pathway protein n=1 Tax=Noviherbaspirillum cavernae TaxID=2320862 RepID=A0A418WVW3_9BURK|nr:FliH/SctL family protein [Noviherbaspirillum cavernae]RJF96872.1 flagellar biosynthesis/type III secretory pathway protein [Noviherbaspirillum cavernae]